MPETTTLYRFYDATNALLYVGISANPGYRITQHRYAKRWWDQVATATFEHYPARSWALVAELRAIRAENPIHNKAGAVDTTWQLLCELEPRLAELERWAVSTAHREGLKLEWGRYEEDDAPDPANVWYGIPRVDWPNGGVKDQLRNLVGVDRGRRPVPGGLTSWEGTLEELIAQFPDLPQPELRLDTDRAYQVAYGHLNSGVVRAFMQARADREGDY